MSECEHMVRDDSGPWIVNMHHGAATDCLFCEVTRLRAQISAALRERDEAREARGTDSLESSRLMRDEIAAHRQVKAKLATAVEALESIAGHTAEDNYARVAERALAAIRGTDYPGRDVG